MASQRRRAREAGVGLVGVLVAVGIMGIVAAGMTTLLSDMFKSSNATKYRVQVDAFNEEVRALLSKPDACRNSMNQLGALNIEEPDVELPALLDDTKPSPKQIYLLNQKYGDRSFTITKMHVGPSGLTSDVITLSLTFQSALPSLGPQELFRTINIATQNDGSSPKRLVGSVALAKMTDGLWQRETPNWRHIFYGGGNVGIGTVTPRGLGGIITSSKTGTVFDAQVAFSVQAANLPDQKDVQINVGDLIMNSRKGGGNSIEAIAADSGSNGNLILGAQKNLYLMTAETTTEATPKVVVNTVGKVGVGNMSPQHIFDVLYTQNTASTDGVRVINAGTGGASLYLHSTASGGRSYQLVSAGSSNGVNGSFGLFDNSAAAWRMIFDPSGNLAIGGVSSANARLHVKGATNSTVLLESVGGGSTSIIDTTGGDGDLVLRASGADGVRIKGNGNVGIGTANPTRKLEVSGAVEANEYFYSSDARLKENVQTLSDSLEKITQLRGVSFDWKASKAPDVGLIAQEVEKVIPAVVGSAKRPGLGELKSVKYANLVAYVIEALKELRDWLLGVDARVERLETENAELRSRLEKLEKRFEERE